jgi:hypothetical protein
MSWLGRPATMLTRSPFRHGPLHPPRIAEIPRHTPRENSVLSEDGGVEGARSADARGDAMALVADVATIAERYPLLRNTL